MALHSVSVTMLVWIGRRSHYYYYYYYYYYYSMIITSVSRRVMGHVVCTTEIGREYRYYSRESRG